MSRTVARDLATASRALLRRPLQRNAKPTVGAVVSFSLSSFVEEGAFAMQQRVIKANIDHIRKLLESETDQPTRAMLTRFLADEEAKQQEYLVRHTTALSEIVR
jgi:hypothetical protein